MKNIKNALLLVAIILFTVSCKNETAPEIKTVETAAIKTTEKVKTNFNPNATFAKAEFKIEGMTCAIGCAKTIEKKIAKMEGVKSAIVNYEKELAMVEYDNALVTPGSLENTVTNVADMYKVKDMKTVENFTTIEE